LFYTVFYFVMCNGFYLTGVPQLIVELRNVLPGFASVFFSVVFRTHCTTTRIQRMPVSFPGGQTCTKRTKLRQYVSACIMYRHVTAPDPLRHVIVTLSVSRMSARHGRWVSLLSFLLHIELRVVFLEWNFCILQRRTLQDMKMLKEAGSCMGDKNVPTGTNTLFSIY